MEEIKNKNRIYDLVINHQGEVLELLEALGVCSPKDKIKKILDDELFEILECTEHEIIKIRKKSTGEIFEKGKQFFHKKYQKWIERICFDESLTGTYYFDKVFYKNYVRGNCGLYRLEDISTTEDCFSIKELEDKYFSLCAEENATATKECKEEAADTPQKYEVLNLKEGDWIWCSHFKEANKIKSCSHDFVKFFFQYSNGLDCGSRDYLENRNPKHKYQRYATPEEIKERLKIEIEKKQNERRK